MKFIPTIALILTWLLIVVGITTFIIQASLGFEDDGFITMAFSCIGSSFFFASMYVITKACVIYIAKNKNVLI